MSAWEHQEWIGGIGVVVFLGLIVLVVWRTRGWEKRE